MTTLRTTRALVLLATAAALPAQDPPAPADASKSPVATIDDAGRLVVRGAPVFVNGWYSDGTIPRLRRLAEGGFNAVLDYGMTARPIEDVKAYSWDRRAQGIEELLLTLQESPGSGWSAR